MQSKQDLCRWLKISLSTVNRLMKKGMPYSKIGKSVRFNKKEVDKWLRGKR